MQDKQHQEDELSTNQEYLIAFVVISLFGLMYWFFMHDNAINQDNKNINAPAILATADTNTSNLVAADNTAANQSKKAELEARRSAAKNLEQSNITKAKEVSLLSEASATEDSMLKTLSEQEQKLAVETKLKQQALKIAELESQKAEDAKKLAEIERLRATEAAQKLTELGESKDKQALIDAEKAARLQEVIDVERKKAEKIALQLIESKKVIEAERLKAESAALRLADLEKLKAASDESRLAEQKQHELAEIERLESEQEMAEIKRKQEQQKALEHENQKSELEARIKAAQDALVLQERDRLSFTLANGKAIKIDSDSLANKLKNSIINKVSKQAIVFDKVLFASGSSALNKESINQIEGVAGVLQAYDSSKVLLRGHTDNTGSTEKNMALSLGRSMQIKKKLVALGIEPIRVSVEGVGSQEPIADNATERGRKENRRIDLLLLDQ